MTEPQTYDKDALDDLLALHALLVSPAFTGSPTAPTPTTGTGIANRDYVDNAVTGLLDLRGGYDASSNLFPAAGGSGTAGAVKKGDVWIASVAGTLGGTAVGIGDLILASVDTPGQTASNWDLGLHVGTTQPLDSDLTAIAALTTTAYGRGVLALANAAALLAYAGAADDTLVTHLAGSESFSGVKSFSVPFRLIENTPVTNSTGVSSVGSPIHLRDATTGNQTCALFSTSGSGWFYIIKKVDASDNTITITPPGGGSIDGYASVVLRAKNDFVMVTSTVTTGLWRIVGYSPGLFTPRVSKQSLGNVTGPINVDLSLASAFDLVLTGNTTVTFTNCPPGNGNVVDVVLRVHQDATGGRTLTITNRQSSFGIDPLLSLSSAANAIDKIACESWDAGAHWDVAIIAQSIA